MKISRFGIYWANLDPVISAEANKTRPVVVVSDNAMNLTLKTVVVCPITSAIHHQWRCRLQISIKRKESEIAVNQIRAISKIRLDQKIGSLSNDEALSLRILVSEMYGNI